MAVCLLDTNILLRGAQPAHPMHAMARDAVEAVRSLGVEKTGERTWRRR